LLAAGLLKGKFPSRIVEFLEAIKALPCLVYPLSGLGNVSRHYCESGQVKLVLDDLVSVVI
jgi:hypothetical protein